MNMIFDITNCVFPHITEHFEGHKIKGLFSINNTHYIVTDIRIYSLKIMSLKMHFA